ncbi:MAG: pseudouridine-5'-phosphate glycosidase, partial [Acidimicrobiales bacterium]
VPIPGDAALDRGVVEAAIERAVAEAGTGPGATPKVLAAIADATGGRTVRANIVLAEHNASVAAAVAREFTQA